MLTKRFMWKKYSLPFSEIWIQFECCFFKVVIFDLSRMIQFLPGDLNLHRTLSKNSSKPCNLSLLRLKWSVLPQLLQVQESSLKSYCPTTKKLTSAAADAKEILLTRPDCRQNSLKYLKIMSWLKFRTFKIQSYRSM